MWKKRIACSLMVSMVFSMAPGNTYAAGWIKSESPIKDTGLSSGWWYSLNDDNNAWYAAEEEQKPAWYWLDGNKDGVAECYAFNRAGWLYSDTVTPDGYTVDGNGAWTIDGNVQKKEVPVSSTAASFRPGSGGGVGGGSSHSGSDSGGGGSSSGGSNTKPDEEDQQVPEVQYTYTIQLVDEDTGTVLKEIKGDGKKGEDISLGGYQIRGYEISTNQPVSVPLQEDGEIFPVRYHKTENTATESNAQKVYSYEINYVDIQTKDVLNVQIGKAEKGSWIEIPEVDIDGYEICPNQRTEFKLVSDHTVQKIYYQAVTEASPSEAQKVQWTVHFVEQDDHNKKIWPSQSGTILDKGTLTINFPAVIHKENGEIWESVEEPPTEHQVYGPGRYIEYVEFICTGNTPEQPDSEAEAKELLNTYLETAKEYEAEITGEEIEQIPEERFFARSQSSNDDRIRSIATQINDVDEHTFYVIGRNFVPNGKTVSEWFGEDAVYSNLLEQVIRIGDDEYYVARMGIQRSFPPEAGRHDWIISKEYAATCLGKGSVIYEDQVTGETQEVITAPLGHIDENQDSICDRCNTRAFEQNNGSKIKAELGSEEMTFTCIDEDYMGGMLYLAEQTTPLSFFEGYGNAAYGESRPYKYFRDGFLNGFSIKNGIKGITLEETNGVSYAMSLSQEEFEKYRGSIDGGKFLLRDNADGQVVGVAENGTCTLQDPASTNYGIRIAIILEKPDEGTPERIHWNIGDLQAQEIDGTTYLFRCIDQNYSDENANHRQTALFLADSLIPANYESDYKVKAMEDGSHQYVFIPGPIVNFGNENDYKYSNIRTWLGSLKESLYNMEPTSIGVDKAFMGSTAEKEYSSFDANSLKSYYIGNQQLKERLFILSVDEAMKYKEYLWKFDGSEEENPDTQYSAFSKGYWLRNPMGDSGNYDTGYAYVVDIVNGNIHPAAVKPLAETGNEELDTTTPYGIRLAFTMPQDR